MIIPNHVHGTNRPVRAHKGRPHPRDLSHNCPRTVPVPFHIRSTNAPHLFHEIEPSATRWDKMEQFGTVFGKIGPATPLEPGLPRRAGSCSESMKTLVIAQPPSYRRRPVSGGGEGIPLTRIEQAPRGDTSLTAHISSASICAAIRAPALYTSEGVSRRVTARRQWFGRAHIRIGLA